MGLTGTDDMLALYNGRARQIPLGEVDLRGPDNFSGPETNDEPSGRRIGTVDNVYTAVPILIQRGNPAVHGGRESRKLRATHYL